MLLAIPASEAVDIIFSRSVVLTIFPFLVSTHVTSPAFCLPKMLHLRSPSSATITTTGVLSCCALESKLLLCHENQHNFTTKYILPTFFPPRISLYSHCKIILYLTGFFAFSYSHAHCHLPNSPDFFCLLFCFKCFSMFLSVFFWWCQQWLCLHTFITGGKVWYKVIRGKDFVLQGILKCCWKSSI